MTYSVKIKQEYEAKYFIEGGGGAPLSALFKACGLECTEKRTASVFCDTNDRILTQNDLSLCFRLANTETTGTYGSTGNPSDLDRITLKGPNIATNGVTSRKQIDARIQKRPGSLTANDLLKTISGSGATSSLLNQAINLTNNKTVIAHFIADTHRITADRRIDLGNGRYANVEICADDTKYYRTAEDTKIYPLSIYKSDGSVNGTEYLNVQELQIELKNVVDDNGIVAELSDKDMLIISKSVSESITAKMTQGTKFQLTSSTVSKAARGYAKLTP